MTTITVKNTRKQTKILEQLKLKILENNTIGMSPFDLLAVIRTDNYKKVKKI